MKVPVITYHAVGNVASPLWTPIDVFEAHLTAFAQSGYRTVTLADLVARLHRGEPLPENSLVITFDDGYESVYTDAWRRLRSHGFGATVFLISDYCGRDNRWSGQPDSVPVAPLLKWEQVKALAAEGCEFGAHTRSHPSLPTLPLEAAVAEILTSQQDIQVRTGQAARIFAYPYGVTNSAVTEMVRQHFDGAVGTDLDLVQTHTNPYLLARIDAYYLSASWIPRMHSSLFQHYLGMRQKLRSVRRYLYPDWQIVQTEDIANV